MSPVIENALYRLPYVIVATSYQINLLLRGFKYLAQVPQLANARISLLKPLWGLNGLLAKEGLTLLIILVIKILVGLCHKGFWSITDFSVMIRYYIVYNLFPEKQVEIAYKVKTKKADALK